MIPGRIELPLPVLQTGVLPTILRDQMDLEGFEPPLCWLKASRVTMLHHRSIYRRNRNQTGI